MQPCSLLGEPILTNVAGYNLGSTLGSRKDPDGCQPIAVDVPGSADCVESWWCHWLLPGTHSMGWYLPIGLNPLLNPRTLQAWIEASTKGAVLLFTASEIETATVSMGVSPAAAGLLGGMGGGIAQAYATMGECNNHMQAVDHR